jgi:hypothetical protein
MINFEKWKYSRTESTNWVQIQHVKKTEKFEPNPNQFFQVLFEGVPNKVLLKSNHLDHQWKLHVF